MSPWRKAYVPIAKARKPTAKQLAALRNQMARAIKIDIKAGIRRFQAKIPPAKLLAAFKSGNYASVMAFLPFDSLKDEWSKAADKLTDAAADAAVAARSELPAGIEQLLRYDLNNPRISKYVDTRIGSLVEKVRDETHENIAAQVRIALQQGKTAPQVAASVRDGLGLNTRQATALANYAGDDSAAYADRLLDQRADMVARTELAFANNQGQRDVWEEAKDQDLLPDGAMQVWTTDFDPCPKICRPMEGVEAAVGEVFTLPDGTEVDGPPGHVCCFCLARLSVPDADNETSRDGLTDIGNG